MAANSIISTSLTLYLLFLTLTAFLPGTLAVFSRRITREEVGLKASVSENNLTQLTFFYHDTLTGANPSAVQIAQAKSATSSFGVLNMIDDPLTETSDPSSKVVGRAQGMYAMADQSETAPITIMNLWFTEGQYNGSTLSVLGRNPVNQGTWELPVVGGTGVFRFAKGYAQAKTQTFDQKSGNSVVEYNVFVSHASGGSSSGGADSGFGGGSGSTPSGSTPSHASCVSIGFVSSLLSVFLVPILYLA